MCGFTLKKVQNSDNCWDWKQSGWRLRKVIDYYMCIPFLKYMDVY